MQESRENTNYWGKKEVTKEKCIEITRKHRKLIMDIFNIFSNKLKELWKNHDKDKETPENLEKYTYLLNHRWEKEAKDERKKIHNHNNTHHVEWFLECDEPKLQNLIEMVCDNLATALARNAKYEDIFEENKNRYMQKWLPENLAIICTNTFIDLRNTIHENREKRKSFSTLIPQIITTLKRFIKNFLNANHLLSKNTQNIIK